MTADGKKPTPRRIKQNRSGLWMSSPQSDDPDAMPSSLRGAAARCGVNKPSMPATKLPPAYDDSEDQA